MAEDIFYDSWKDKGFDDVETIIKDKIRTIDEGQYTRITVTVEGGTMRTFVSSVNEVTFKYKVDNQFNGSYSNNFSVYFQVEDGIRHQINKGIHPDSPDVLITSDNVLSWLNSTSNTEIQCKLIVVSGEDSTTKELNMVFTKVAASLYTPNNIANVDPSSIPYEVRYDVPSGTDITLQADFYNSTGSGSSVSSTVDIKTTGSVDVPVPFGLSAGAHVVKAKLIIGTDGFESNEAVTSIIVSNGAGAKDCYITSEPIQDAEQSSFINLKFCAYAKSFGNTENIVVRLQARNPSNLQYEDVVEGGVNVENGTIYTWRYLIPYEENYLRILVQGSDNDDRLNNTSLDIFVPAEATNIGWRAKPNELFHFSARNHSNADAHPDSWTNNNYSMEFEDMQWDNTGSGWRENCLHLSGKSRCRIFSNTDNDYFYPFYSTNARGILSTGFALKIRYRVTNVSNPDENVISCYSEGDQIGFYITGDALFIDFKNKIISDPKESQAVTSHNTRRFSANQIMDVLITCQPYRDSSGETDRMLCYYVNGEIGGFAKLSSDTLSQSLANRTVLEFGGDGAQLDIYDIRFYNSYATSFEALQTHTMDLDSAEAVRAEFNKNNFYELNGSTPFLSINTIIAYGKYLAEQGHTNFAVAISTDLAIEYTDTKSWNKDPQSFYIFRFKTDATGKGIIDPELTKWVEADANGLRIRKQGTSTASIHKGNARINVQNTARVHDWNAGEQKFYYKDTEAEHIHLVTENAAIWQIPDANAIPCYLLTLKKNPNESTQARNLPTAKMYEDGARYLASTSVAYEDLLTPPQREEFNIIQDDYPEWSRTDQVAAIKTRQCIDGIPSIVFLLDDKNLTVAQKADPINSIPNSAAPFAGQFDLITDKTNMDVFGFSGDDTFSIEFRNNQSPFCSFHVTDLTNAGTKTPSGTAGSGALEYRYPDIDTVGGDWEPSQEHPDGKATIGLGFNSPMQKLYDFVYNCSPGGIADSHIRKTSVNGVISDNGGIITVNGEEYEDTVENRALKFKEELGNFVVVNQIIYNAIMILSGLMVDQDKKNQFWTYFQSNHNYDLVNGNKLIRLLGYDFDSSWGMDNENSFRFLYTVLYEDGLYDGKDEDRDSDFWTLVFSQFKDEIAAMNKDLHAGGFMTKASVLRYMHDNQVDVYNAMMYNANSEYSYLDSGADYKKAHGSAKEHNEWFVEGRMHFMSGMTFKDFGDTGDFGRVYTGYINVATFDSIKYSDDDPTYDVGGRSYNPNQYYNQFNRIDGSDVQRYWEIKITGYERTYAALGVDRIVQNTRNTNFVDANTEVSFKSNNAFVGGAEVRLYIWGGKHLKKVDGLHRWYIQSINDWGDLVNLEELKLGHYGNVSTGDGQTTPYRNSALTSLGLGTNTVFGSCKKLDLGGCSGMSGTVDLSKFPVLEEFEGRNMDSTAEVKFPSGSSLTTVHLPANLTAIEIKNKPNIETIDLQSHDSLQRIVCTGSSNYATMVFIEMLTDLNV